MLNMPFLFLPDSLFSLVGLACILINAMKKNSQMLKSSCVFFPIFLTKREKKCDIKSSCRPMAAQRSFARTDLRG